MKEIDPLARLQAFVAKHPTQGAAADALEISGAYLSDLLKGRREPSPAILERLGLRRVVVEAGK
jgi:transcriptional regulator with XRE-family HTH domain